MLDVPLLQASTEVLSLSTLLYVADTEAITARVFITPRGTLDIVEGEIVGASIGELTGVDALLELFVDQGTAVVLRPPAVRGGASLGGTVRLMFEGARRADEWERVRSCPVAWRTGVPEVDPVLTPLLSAVDGVRTGHEVAQVSGLPRHLVGDVLAGWLEEGLIRLGRPRETVANTADNRTQDAPAAVEPATAVELGDLGFFDCIDEGRAAYKRGELDQAIAAFEAALAHRPGDRLASQNLKRARIRLERV